MKRDETKYKFTDNSVVDCKIVKVPVADEIAPHLKAVDDWASKRLKAITTRSTCIIDRREDDAFAMCYLLNEVE